MSKIFFKALKNFLKFSPEAYLCEMIDLLELLKYLVPVLLIAAILCYYFEKILRALENLLNFTENKHPTELNVYRLQAYERMAIFLERIRPTQLVRRVDLLENPNLYEYSLIKTIQEEFEHNVSQQIYIHPDTWQLIFSTKNMTQNFIKNCKENLSENFTSEQLRDEVIAQSINEKAPSSDALLKLQKDIQALK